MSQRVIAYPLQFLERPVDRLLLSLLKGKGIDQAVAMLLLYRIWADYGTGGNDRREVCPDPTLLGRDRQVIILEDFCRWGGDAGVLVELAIEAGFLMHEVREGRGSLVCVDFFPINSNWSRSGTSFQAKGGFTRSSNNQKAKSEKAAAERMELWRRNQASFDVPESDRGAALILINRICRALDLNVPDDEELRAGALRMAVECLQSYEEESLNRTLIWLISKRSDQSMPNRMDAVLRQWQELTRQAKLEIT